MYKQILPKFLDYSDFTNVNDLPIKQNTIL